MGAAETSIVTRYYRKSERKVSGKNGRDEIPLIRDQFFSVFLSKLTDFSDCHARPTDEQELVPTEILRRLSERSPIGPDRR
jgi:hypothetical protein